VSGDNVIICGALEHGDLLSEILTGARLPCSRSLERTSSRARCGSKALARWMTEQFGAGAAGKKIPAWLHGMPSDYRSEFLAGYAEADGHKEDMPRGGSVQRFTTVSRAVAIGIRVLLNQSGISASITRHHSGRETIIEGRRVSERPFFRITAYEASRSFRFTDLHGWGLVRSVEAAGRARVYNLAVEEDESYTADGIVVHNCQPFSAAGKGEGFADERHLWPAFHYLIEQCQPPVVFGEQVASKDGLAWLDLVQADLEGTGYASGAVDLCAAGVGAPHIRQRLWWVAERGVGQADAYDTGLEGRRRAGERAAELAAGTGSVVDGMEHGACDGRLERRAEPSGRGATGRCGDGRMADADGREQRDGNLQPGGQFGFQPQDGSACGQADCGLGRNGGPELERAGPTNGFWRDPDWLFCRDGKWRPVESGTFPLAHGLARGMGTLQPELRRLAEVAGLDGKSLARAKAHRIGSLKGYGNAIVAEAATEVIAAFMDVYGVPSLDQRVAA